MALQLVLMILTMRMMMVMTLIILREGPCPAMGRKQAGMIMMKRDTSKLSIRSTPLLVSNSNFVSFRPADANVIKYESEKDSTI